MISRLLSIAMFLLLPLQVTWAAISPYCQHEVGLAAQHLGHHEHNHDHSDQYLVGENSQDQTAIDQVLVQENGSSDANIKSATVNDGLDSDCGTCHSSCATAILGREAKADVVSVPTNANHSDARASNSDKGRPERPNWSSLA
jgi:hypothetical protein